MDASPPPSPPGPSGPPELPRLLGRDYWLVTSTPLETTTAAQIRDLAPTHVAWLLELEDRGVVVLSGPLVAGPGARPGSGVTVLRAADAEAASAIAAQDPFVVAGLRTFTVHQWRVNEGSVSVRLSLGRGTIAWE